MPRYTNNNSPTESEEQQALFEWARWEAARHPELSLMHHIPNGGYRTKTGAALLAAEGVKAGVPDICLPVARGGYHGLYIELKRSKRYSVSDAQTQMMEALIGQGYCVALCVGCEAAIDTIKRYLKLKGDGKHDGRQANDDSGEEGMA